MQHRIAQLTAVCTAGSRTIQTESHLIADSPPARHVKTISKFMRYPTSLAKCEFTLDRRGYSQIEIKFRLNQYRSHLVIEKDAGNKYFISHNGLEREELVAFNPEGFILFDGPNPQFDYNNSMALYGLPPGRMHELVVNRIDWLRGTIHPVHYQFHTSSDGFLIQKTAVSSCEIVLGPNQNLAAYHSQQYKYLFNHG